MKKKAKMPKSAAMTTGFKMPKQRAVGPKKSEPDDPIMGRQNQPLGGKKAANPGAKASASAARMKRLSGVRI